MKIHGQPFGYSNWEQHWWTHWGWTHCTLLNTGSWKLIAIKAFHMQQLFPYIICNSKVWITMSKKLHQKYFNAYTRKQGFQLWIDSTVFILLLTFMDQPSFQNPYQETEDIWSAAKTLRGKKKKRGEFPNLTSSCCMPGVPAGLLLRAGSSPPWAQHHWWCCKEGLRARPRHSSPSRNPLSTLQGGSPTHLPALLLPRGVPSWRGDESSSSFAAGRRLPDSVPHCCTRPVSALCKHQQFCSSICFSLQLVIWEKRWDSYRTRAHLYITDERSHIGQEKEIQKIQHSLEEKSQSGHKGSAQHQPSLALVEVGVQTAANRGTGQDGAT